MIPLRDSAARRRLTTVNSALIAANLMVFAYEYTLGARLPVFLLHFAMQPARISAWLGALDVPGQAAALWVPATLVTSLFLHAGFLHIAGNLLYLFIFGAAVEGRLGGLRYFWFYLASGVAAGLAMVAMAPASPVPIIGASGAIAGVLGAYFILYPRGRILTILPLFIFVQFIEVPAVIYLLLWFAVQLWAGLIEGARGAVSGGVAWWAHVGGFLFGMALGPLVARSAPRRRRIR
jgi:rhomboid family protein